MMSLFGVCFYFYFLTDFLSLVQVWDRVGRVTLKLWVQNLSRHQKSQ